MPINADPITRCTTGEVVRDTKPTDQFAALVPSQAIPGVCYRYGRMSQADMAAVAITFPASGALDDVKVDIGASEELPLATMAAKVEVSGDIATNLSQAASVLDAEAMAVVDAMARAKLDALYAATPPANAPRGLAYAAGLNPSGELQPLRGMGEPASFKDYLCMKAALGVPWSPNSPLFYVLPSRLYYGLHEMAMAGGGSGLLDYHRNPVTGTSLPHFCSTGVLLSEHCPEDRAYLTMLDGDTTVMRGTKGFSSVHPERNAYTGQGGPDFYVGPVTADPSDDLYFRIVTHGYAWVPGSAGATVVLKDVG